MTRRSVLHRRTVPPRTVWQALGRAPWRFLFSRWVVRAFAYLFISAALGLILLPLGIVFLFFLPIQGILLGHVERYRVRLLGFSRISSPHVRMKWSEWRSWLGVRLGEPGTWRELVSLLVTLVFGFVALTFLFFFALALFLLIAVAIELAKWPDVALNLFGNVYTNAAPQAFAMTVFLGVLVVVLGCYLVGLLAAGQGAIARLLLSPREEELERQVARLTRSRMSLVDAFESERLRIERELHDGVQQRLVALTMQLGIADLELATAGRPAAAARDAVARAHEQAEEALADLRRTVRGIYPQVLADHGLAAAVVEIAGRSPVPVEVELDIGRLSSPVEAAAYFTVSEALTNALRHASATRIRVTGTRTNSQVRVVIADDGIGGADPDAGSGLAGLAQRADTLGGALEVSSPAGGPTRVGLTLPTVLTSGD